MFNAYLTVYWFTTGYKFGVISLKQKDIEVHNKLTDYSDKLGI